VQCLSALSQICHQSNHHTQPIATTASSSVILASVHWSNHEIDPSYFQSKFYYHLVATCFWDWKNLKPETFLGFQESRSHNDSLSDQSPQSVSVPSMLDIYVRRCILLVVYVWEGVRLIILKMMTRDERDLHIEIAQSYSETKEWCRASLWMWLNDDSDLNEIHSKIDHMKKIVNRKFASRWNDNWI
jgi:hypothetical protein